MSDQQKNQLLDHDYDGIKECDNLLPRWWLQIFYITVVFSFGYMAFYHMGAGQSQTEIFDKELANEKSKEAPPVLLFVKSDIENILKDPQQVASAKVLFLEKCSPCHGIQGGGGIGPNLTDAYWLHGGSVEKVAGTISEGVLEKGMISWKTMLNHDQIAGLTAYIMSIKGSSPSNPKAAQGQLENER